jgi:hypothetical protein
MHFHALWQQALAPALTTASENGAAILGFHAGAEAELAFTRAFRSLVSAFHKIRSPISWSKEPKE